MGKRIGILGGTFDPIHNGHLQIAYAAFDQFELDEVRFVVAYDPWQKSHLRRISDSGVRLEMVRSAISGIEWAVADDSEIEAKTKSYTYDTVQRMRSANPDNEILLIVGDDVADTIDTWHKSAELSELVGLLVYDRLGGIELPITWNARRIEGMVCEISATDIRERSSRGESIEHLVPMDVAEVIACEHLYSENDATNSSKETSI